MSDWALPLALAAGGLASGFHCAAMCGGISAGFSLVRQEGLWKRQFAFNAGRISSYAAAGAIAGALGSAAAYAASVLPAQIYLYFFAGAFAILAGAHLLGLPTRRLESIGLPLWRRVQPVAARLLSARTLPQSYAAGLAWGCLPCGLVYGALAAAVFAGGALEGAAAMAAFGLGTLPWLLASGVLAARLRSLLSVRRASGVALIAAGGLGVAHAAQGVAAYCF
ncbi:MAG TPA: sulfite exporter TauE/SafE family protein [Burkholderiales bacterium]